MLTFMTVRELYEMACSGSTMETDQDVYKRQRETDSEMRFPISKRK